MTLIGINEQVVIIRHVFITRMCVTYCVFIVQSRFKQIINMFSPFLIRFDVIRCNKQV